MLGPPRLTRGELEGSLRGGCRRASPRAAVPASQGRRARLHARCYQSREYVGLQARVPGPCASRLDHAYALSPGADHGLEAGGRCSSSGALTNHEPRDGLPVGASLRVRAPFRTAPTCRLPEAFVAESCVPDEAGCRTPAPGSGLWTRAAPPGSRLSHTPSGLAVTTSLRLRPGRGWYGSPTPSSLRASPLGPRKFHHAFGSGREEHLAGQTDERPSYVMGVDRGALPGRSVTTRCSRATLTCSTGREPESELRSVFSDSPRASLHQPEGHCRREISAWAGFP